MDSTGETTSVRPRDNEPDWEYWRHVPVLSLLEFAALSLGLEPNWIPRAIEELGDPWSLHHSALDAPAERLMYELRRRQDILEANLEKNGGQLMTSVSSEKGPCVRVEELVRFAENLRWKLSPKFALGGASGSILRLPYRSEELDKLAAAIDERGAAKGLPNSALEMGKFLDKVFGWIGNEKEASRNAQALAPFLLAKKDQTSSLRRGKVRSSAEKDMPTPK